MSKRIPLMPSDNLHLNLNNGSSMDFSIIEVIGYGGSCIVYRGQSSSFDNIPCTQIIKEFYPADIHSIKRLGGKLVVPEQDFASFTLRKQEFYNAVSKYSQYFESNSSYANARPFLSGEANGTAYAVSDPSQGTVLSHIDRSDLNLYGISRIMYSVCSAMQNFHNNGLLYLDCKPDNIFVYDVDRQYHIRLFDFDTVAKISDIKSGKYTYKTYSPAWAPGEQKNWRIAEIGQETDIYSVGAVFFYLLTGIEPNNNDIRKIAKSCYPWRNLPTFLTKASDKSLQISQQILAKTLQPASSARYRSISNLKEDFQTLSSITKGTYIEDSSIYDELTLKFASLEQTLVSLTKSNLNNIIDNISSPELKEALLSEQAKLSDYKSKYSAASKEYQTNPSPISKVTLDITEKVFKQQQEKLERLQRDIIDNLKIIIDHQSRSGLDHREEIALKAAACGNYTQANYILYDPEWKNDILSLHTVMADIKVKCQQYISAQKLIISNLRAARVDDKAKAEIIEIYRNVMKLCEDYQIEYSVLYDYTEFCLKEHDYHQGILWGERLLHHLAIQGNIPDIDAAKLHVLLGELYYSVRDYQKSSDSYNRAMEIYKLSPDKNKLELIRLYNDIADLCWLQNNYQGIKDTLANAMSFLEPQSNLQDDSYLLALSNTYNRMATSANKKWLLDEAEEYHLKALHLRESLLDKRPNDDDILLCLSTSLSNLGILYRRMKRYEDAENCYKKSYNIRLAGYNRNKAKFAKSLAMVCGNYAFLLSSIGRIDESESLIELSLDIKKHLAEEYPDAYSRNYAHALDDLGYILTQSNDEVKLKKADIIFKQAIDMKSKLAEEDYFPHSYVLAESYVHYAQLLKKVGKIQDAEAYYRKALPIFSELESNNPGYYEHDLATSLFELAELISCNDRLPEIARPLYQQSLYYGERVMQNCSKYFRLDFIATINGLVKAIKMTTDDPTELEPLFSLLSQLETNK